MRNGNRMRRATRQGGAVLVISLLLLLVMTLLGLGASQSTRLQERMAGNQRDLELARQGAEAGLRAAEDELPSEQIIDLCNTPGACNAYLENTLARDLARQSDEWWNTWAQQHIAAGQLQSLSQPPQFVNERIARMRDTLSEGDTNFKAVREYYRSTARSRGVSDSAEVIVQSSYGRITFE